MVTSVLLICTTDISLTPRSPKTFRRNRLVDQRRHHEKHVGQDRLAAELAANSLIRAGSQFSIENE